MSEKPDTFSIGPLEFLSSFKGRPTEFVDYGNTPIGKRVDIHFEGELTGDALSGTMRGIDYIRVRSDGVVELDVRAVILTHDGVNISVQISGYQCGEVLKDNQIKLLSGDDRYRWLNDKIIVGKGMVMPDGLEVDYFYEP
jgi:hypothetical protein